MLSTEETQRPPSSFLCLNTVLFSVLVSHLSFLLFFTFLYFERNKTPKVTVQYLQPCPLLRLCLILGTHKLVKRHVHYGNHGSASSLRMFHVT